jgi:uncharacterized metal-binding protein
VPDGRTHDKIALVACVPLAPMAYTALLAVGDTPERAAPATALLLAAHLFGSFWLSPDLDLDSSVDDRWGPFFWIWRPYMWVVPHRHRILSHSGFSALLRLGYLYGAIMLLLVVWAYLMGLLKIVPERAYYLVFHEWLRTTLIEHHREAFLIGLGVVFSDALHTVTDHLSTHTRRGLRFFGVRMKLDYRFHDVWRPRRSRRRRMRLW